MAGDSHATMTSALPANPPELWRSAEELADTPEFREMIGREFPDDVDTWTDPVSRRKFLTLMGASMALAGLNGCSPRPASPQKIVPYSTIPEGMVPGIPMFFASANVLGGYAKGIVVKSNEGRPTKVEGNPLHPASLGSTDIFAQAAILDLYDPDRSQSIVNFNASRTWEDTTSTLRAELDKLKDKKGGPGIRVLTETVTSPSLHEQIKKFTAKHNAKWVQYEPANRDNVRAGAKQAFGADVNVIYDFTKANVVLALDGDFLSCGPGSVRYSRDFMSRRKVREAHEDGGKAADMNRLYAVESMLTSAGAIADHRLAMKSGDVENFARAIARELQVPNAPAAASLPDNAKAWLAPLLSDLSANKGKCVVVAGDHQPASVHALAHAINNTLGNIGTTVIVTDPVEVQPDNQLNSFQTLAKEMADGKVDFLLILGGNPVFNAPADIDFAAALDKVALRVHLGLYQDETGSRCQWHINEAHSLEAWGDARAYDGTPSIMQPLIAPLYSGRSSLELLSALSADPSESQQSGHDLVKSYWKGQYKGEDFEKFWHDSVRTGVVAGFAAPQSTRSVDAGNWAKSDATSKESGTEVCFRPDPTIYDGRFANNGWLQELPKPVSKICWENAAIMSPKTAEKYGIDLWFHWTAGERGRSEVQYVEINFKGRKIKAAAWPQPGHADDSITLYFGYGREIGGRSGTNAGVNVYKVRPSDAMWNGGGAEVKKIDEGAIIACTQAHHSMENRKPVRRMTVAEYGDKKAFAKAMEPVTAAGEYDLIKQNVPGPHEKSEHDKHPHEHHKHEGEEHDKEHKHEHDKRLMPLTMYPPSNKDGRRWGMTIDLTSCTGCNVCMIACMAENNIPVIGKFEVTRAREMYWIRVDRYYEGDAKDSDGLKTYFQPVPCQQCEKAPCEVVCPVGATVHSTDGLNDMVYNRCVGTRYCSNNCPYKVRRFNFLTYADWVTESLKLGRNPEVTVRSRGVMEKCTYCVQRIREGEIKAEREFRPIKDGEIVTACQAACPSQAIAFGDISDTKSVVRRWKAEPTNYGLLEELNTMPRTSYLATVRNPNPDMPKGA